MKKGCIFVRKKLKTGLICVGVATMLAGCGQNAGTAAKAATKVAVSETASEETTTESVSGTAAGAE